MKKGKKMVEIHVESDVIIRKEEMNLRISDEIFTESVNAMDEALSFWEEEDNE